MAFSIIDTHAHAYDKRFAEEREALKERAKTAGLSQVLLPNVDENSLADLLALHRFAPDFYLPMLGLHPCSVGSNPIAQLENLWQQAEKEAHWIAVGEIGLDLYWEKETLPQQQEALAWQIEKAKHMQLPICLHTRDAHQETIDVLNAVGCPDSGGVFHCFTGTVEQAKEILDLGFFLGIGGVLTFKNSGLAPVMAAIGLDKVLLETDSPYLAPVPYRGKRNEPAYTALVLEALAQATGLSMEKTAEITSQNAKALFRLAETKKPL